MEQHPVPQNITTFQFRLIGDMTIRQFAYLAVSIVIGYICYQLPIPAIFSWPLAIGFGLLGVGLAFVPVEERPMDTWILSFIRNVYAPTQYVWKKTAKKPSPPKVTAVVSVVQTQAPQAKQKTFKDLLATLAPLLPHLPHEAGVLNRLLGSGHQSKPSQPAVAIVSHRKITRFFSWLFARRRQADIAPATLSPVGSSPAGTKPQKNFPSTAPATSAPMPAVQKPYHPTEDHGGFSSPDDASRRRILELQNELSRLLAEHEKLTKEVATLRTEGRIEPKTTFIVGPGVLPEKQAKPTVRAIAPSASAQIGVPRLTTFSNVVTGIVKDEHGVLLPGILITVRDAHDVPIRAFKTNRIGQFAASTPLPNGPYMVEVEDPKGERVFDRIQITASGVLIPTLEIFAKSKKQQTRDALAREIFGSAQT